MIIPAGCFACTWRPLPVAFAFYDTGAISYNASMAPLSAQSDAPVLSVSQVRACDARALSHYGMCSLILMENAGASAAAAVRDLLSDADTPGVCIFTGTGNNGGDGFCCRPPSAQ